MRLLAAPFVFVFNFPFLRVCSFARIKSRSLSQLATAVELSNAQIISKLRMRLSFTLAFCHSLDARISPRRLAVVSTLSETSDPPYRNLRSREPLPFQVLWCSPSSGWGAA